MVWSPYFGDPPSKDFLIEVALGNEEGFRIEGFQMEGNIDDTGMGDIWGGPGNLIYTDTPVTLRIKSDNDEDNPAGTGMRTANIISLNDDKLLTITPVTLDGQNFVNVAGTHMRPHLVAGVDSGSHEENVGTITLSEVASGNVWNVIKPDIGISHDGHFTVPSIETGQFLNLFIAAPYNSNLTGLTKIRDGSNPNPTWLSSAPIYAYQSLVNFEVFAKLPLDAESDVKVQSIAGSGNFNTTWIFEMLYIAI